MIQIPYFTFVKTYLSKSKMDKAGNGIFAKEDIKPFKWIGFYPGKIIDTKVDDIKYPRYVMGTLNPQTVIEGNPKIKKGVHLVNESNRNNPPNVWYIKLKNLNCLYFAGRYIKKGEELITCYSSSYGIRDYSICNNCTDPRCNKNKNKNKNKNNHRDNSNILQEWISPLKLNAPTNDLRKLI